MLVTTFSHNLVGDNLAKNVGKDSYFKVLHLSTDINLKISNNNQHGNSGIFYSPRTLLSLET
jgi:hypothetical protein